LSIFHEPWIILTSLTWINLHGVGNFLYSCQKAYRSLNAIVAQSKNCSFGVNTATDLKNITYTSGNNGIQRGVFQLSGGVVLSDAIAIFFSSVVLSSNVSFLVVAALHSVSYIV
jgi:hypothetical protein